MQGTQRLVARSILLAACSLWACGLLASSLLVGRARAQEGSSAVTASSGIYVRSDTDHTTVITPRVQVSAPLTDETRLDLVYTVDVWSSASIDIVTAASRRVTEQRDELNVNVEHAFPDVTLSGGYRYSTEYDYESHGGSLGGSFDFADNNATVALGAHAYFDRVGKAGDPDFDKPSSTVGARASFTQVIDPTMFGQLTYELNVQDGYLSSPYRYVRLAMDAGSVPSTCLFPVGMCRPEENPDLRTRHAIAAYLRRALGETLSIGGSYRFYLDDWGMSSHTLGVDGAWLPAEDWVLSLGYRLYHQSSVSHFKPFYEPMLLPAHYTSDKELTALTSHRLELEVARTFKLDDVGSELTTVLLASPSIFFYHEFLPLDQISAIELTFSVEVKL